MQNDEPKIIHFGNFLRWRLAEFGGIRSAIAASGVSISPDSVCRWVRAATLADTRISPDNRRSLLTLTRFDTWEDLIAAWQVKPLAPFPKTHNGRNPKTV